jgi:hypothetical protein
MSYTEDILKLRARVADAVKAGVVDESGKPTLEAILVNIMNEAEKNRQNCVAQAENLRRQAAGIDGQAAAFNSTVSIVFSVVNGLVKIAERSNEEEKARAEQEATERAEKEKLMADQAAQLAAAEEEAKKAFVSTTVVAKKPHKS